VRTAIGSRYTGGRFQSNPRFQFDPRNVGKRRVAVVAARSGEGLLSILLQAFIVVRCKRWFAFTT
jgi:hypothetical protein